MKWPIEIQSKVRWEHAHTRSIRVGSRWFFAKSYADRTSSDMARKGYFAVRSIELQVPALVVVVPGLWRWWHIYDHIGTDGHLPLTLADLLAEAENGNEVDKVESLIKKICADLVRGWLGRLYKGPLNVVSTNLYSDRLVPGGRLECFLRFFLARLGVNANDRLIFEGPQVDTILRPHVMVDQVRKNMQQKGWCTVGHGDMTDTNICVDRRERGCFVDFDHAGNVSVAGEIACLLISVWAHGGWLRPLLQQRNYADKSRVTANLSLNAATGTFKARSGTVSIGVAFKVSAVRKHVCAILLREFCLL